MTRVVFEPWSDFDVLHVCLNMRACDAEEIFALSYEDDPWGYYRLLAAQRPLFEWFEVVRPADDITPVAIFGVSQTGPGQAVAHLAATDGFTLPMALLIAKRVRETLKPVMLEAGLHRIEALSLSSHRWAHRFLRQCGAVSEGTRAGIGRAGEDYECFVWLKSTIQPKENDNVRNA